MNEYEEEFLTQIAAGTDPLTAWAANPSHDDDGDSRPAGGPVVRGCSGYGCLAAILVAVALVLVARFIK